MLYSPGHASLKVKVRFGGKAPELLCVCGGIQMGGSVKAGALGDGRWALKGVELFGRRRHITSCCWATANCANCWLISATAIY